MGLSLDVDTRQKIFIGENIIVFVNGRKGRKTRVVIEAPKELYIRREKDFESLEIDDRDEEWEFNK